MNGLPQLYHHARPFAMERGGELSEFTLAYETWGTLNADGSNALLIMTGMSPGAHVASGTADPTPGWWEDIVGPGKPMDTDRWFVICANSLGSCKGSTGPASSDPKTEETYRLTFPDLTLGDIARSTHELLEHLNIQQLAVLVGPSMGGMTALAHTLTYPGFQRALISISSALKPSAYAIAARSLQREFVRNDPAWQSGQYPMDDGPNQGMRLARKLGMTTYRSAAEWQQRFDNKQIADTDRTDDPFGPVFEIESYLALHADRFAGSFDANCYLYLSRAMDRFDATQVSGGLEVQLRASGLESALVMGTSSDALFPLEQQHSVAAALRAAKIHVDFRPLDSIQGHDSFLVDTENFGLVIAEYLANR